ncbi:MAG TPA: serpin family protein [Thermoanaerobaculia bacterium]|nr:serpin family protein [Thermoanaerobaculia bacterium]
MTGKDAAAKLAQSSNAFGFDLYQRLRQKPGNLVLSPASITTALAMPWGGARGETAAQMRTVLHLEGTADEVMAASGELSRSLQDPSRPIVFRIANQLFAEKSYKLVPAYVEKTRASFGAPVELLDFKTAPERGRVRINEWVEGKTERRIKDLIPPRGVEKDTRLVLVNAIYFLGDWAVPFDAGETRPAPFHLTASEQKRVPTMNRMGSLRFAEKEGLTAVEMPYKGGELSMLILVPAEIEGITAVEKALDAKRLDEIVGALQWGLVDLSVPKFEVNPGESLSLGEDLKALGMPLAFDRDKADFTGIADPPNPADRLVLAKVFHKAFVRVDEKGTEAAAATAVIGVMAGAAPGPGPRRLRVDRPFLFLIRDNASGLVLFLGRVSDPSRT